MDAGWALNWQKHLIHILIHMVDCPLIAFVFMVMPCNDKSFLPFCGTHAYIYIYVYMRWYLYVVGSAALDGIFQYVQSAYEHLLSYPTHDKHRQDHIDLGGQDGVNPLLGKITSQWIIRHVLVLMFLRWPGCTSCLCDARRGCWRGKRNLDKQWMTVVEPVS